MAPTARKPESPDFPHTIMANEYGFYCVPDEYKGREVPNILQAGQVYEPATIGFLRRHLGTHDIVTGGTFIGDFLPALHQKLAPKAHIHTFEPVPTTYAAAMETIRLNKLDRIKLHPVAVGEEDGTVAMQIARPQDAEVKIAAGARIVEGESQGQDHLIDVTVTTIDALVPKSRKVGILHLDVEGFEQNALKGAARILTKDKPLVVVEAGKRWRQALFARLLDEIAPDASYRLSGVIERNAVYLPA